MKIPEVLHLATYESYGGAARATKRIYQALKAQPVRCHMFTMLKTSEDESIQAVQPMDPYSRMNYVHALLNSYHRQKLGRNTILESYGEISAGIVDQINAHQAPLVHLHWISNLLSIADIGRINKPIVWTLHDMWPFIGSEHLNHDPDAFFYGIPTKDTANEDTSVRTFRLKLEYWKHKEITFVAPSNWLADCARRSILVDRREVTVIPCPIDHVFWSPRKSRSSHTGFHFDVNKKQILFIGQNPVNDPNKGWDLLQETLKRFFETGDVEFELVVVGHSGELVSEVPYSVHSLGEISADEILVDLYSAVDLLLVPSRAEAFSQVTLEAQSCGLPVVGFDIGGIPDIIIHRKTGWISPAFDIDDFSEGIDWILREEGRPVELGSEARRNVIERFSPERVSRKYHDLYQRILSEGKGE